MLPLPEKRRGRTPGGAKHQQRQQLENKNHGLIARLKRIWAFKTKLVGVTDTHMGKYFVLKLAVVEICEGSSQGCVYGAVLDVCEGVSEFAGRRGVCVCACVCVYLRRLIVLSPG